MTRNGFGVGALTALDTDYPAAGIAVGEVTATDDESEAIPNICDLAYLHGQLDTIVTAATLTWFVAFDEDGDIALTDEVTETIKTGEDDATNGAIATILNLPHRLSGIGTLGTLYIFAKVDAGTCNLTPRLFFRVNA